MRTLTHRVLRHKRLVVALWLILTIIGIVAAGPASKALDQRFSVPGRRAGTPTRRSSAPTATAAERSADPGGEASRGQDRHSPAVRTSSAGSRERPARRCPAGAWPATARPATRRSSPATARSRSSTLPAAHRRAVRGQPRRREGRAQGARRRAGRRRPGPPDRLRRAVRSAGEDRAARCAPRGGDRRLRRAARAHLRLRLRARVRAAAAWRSPRSSRASCCCGGSRRSPRSPPIVQFLVALIGLGISIDYALLVVVRWREEREKDLGRRGGGRRDGDGRPRRRVLRHHGRRRPARAHRSAAALPAQRRLRRHADPARRDACRRSPCSRRSSPGPGRARQAPHPPKDRSNAAWQRWSTFVVKHRIAWPSPRSRSWARCSCPRPTCVSATPTRTRSPRPATPRTASSRSRTPTSAPARCAGRDARTSRRGGEGDDRRGRRRRRARRGRPDRRRMAAGRAGLVVPSPTRATTRPEGATPSRTPSSGPRRVAQAQVGGTGP